MKKIDRKSVRVLLGTLLAYIFLVATHEGEFWPFSIYPMFSQAGRPWTRTLVRELSPDSAKAVRWQPTALQSVPGTPFPLVPQGINQNDVANYVSKSKVWDRERVQGFRAIFGRALGRSHHLLVLRVQGTLTPSDSVTVTATPFLLLTPDSTYLNPTLSVRQ